MWQTEPTDLAPQVIKDPYSVLPQCWLLAETSCSHSWEDLDSSLSAWEADLCGEQVLHFKWELRAIKAALSLLGTSR